jgi:hypothetical protein
VGDSTLTSPLPLAKPAVTLVAHSLLLALSGEGTVLLGFSLPLLLGSSCVCRDTEHAPSWGPPRVAQGESAPGRRLLAGALRLFSWVCLFSSCGSSAVGAA